MLNAENVNLAYSSTKEPAISAECGKENLVFQTKKESTLVINVKIQFNSIQLALLII